jgi:hypothetical protein
MPDADIPPDMKDALAKFGDEADQIIDRSFRTVDQNPPPIIYHYTNDVGLKGILEEAYTVASGAISIL